MAGGAEAQRLAVGAGRRHRTELVVTVGEAGQAPLGATARSAGDARRDRRPTCPVRGVLEVGQARG